MAARKRSYEFKKAQYVITFHFTSLNYLKQLFKSISRILIIPLPPILSPRATAPSPSLSATPLVLTVGNCKLQHYNILQGHNIILSSVNRSVVSKVEGRDMSSFPFKGSRLQL
jgi:hypothetical protein